MFLKNSRREDEEEEDRAGSPQLEADLAFELILQVNQKLLLRSQKKQLKNIFFFSLNRTLARNGLKNLGPEQDV